MLVLSSCKSNRIKANKETKADVYFPVAPYPKDGLIIPVKICQKDFINNDTYISVKVIKDKDTKVEYAMVPYWWLLLCADYFSKSEAAFQALSVE